MNTRPGDVDAERLFADLNIVLQVGDHVSLAPFNQYQHFCGSQQGISKSCLAIGTGSDVDGKVCSFNGGIVSVHFAEDAASQSMDVHHPAPVFSSRVGGNRLVQKAKCLLKLSLFIRSDKAEAFITVGGQRRNGTLCKQRLLKAGYSFVNPALSEQYSSALIANPSSVAIL